ncbi:MAG: SAM-dependent methyltransferase, partial [Chitinophagaceae bacterium]
PIKACLEVSDDMYRESIRRNQSRVNDGIATFKLYDGEALPFENAMFNAIMSVNTVYFWNDPIATCRELLRVLKPGGYISIAFAQKIFMEQLPFTKEKFKLVDTADVNNILESAGLQIVRTIDEVEKVKSKAGELVDRPYTVVVATNVS